jgi:hypothetical protein
MKLFYWDSVERLRGYQQGQCFALADSLPEAIDRVVFAFESAFGEGYGKDLRAELEATKPEIHETPIGFFIWGGD